MSVGLGSTVEEIIKAINSGGGGESSGGATYAHLVSFGFYRTDDADIAGWGSIMIPSASADVIVGTSADNLKTFLAKFNGKFYPLAIKTDGYTTTPYTGIFVNPTNNLLKVVSHTTSRSQAEFAIDVYDITETVVQTSTGGSGGGSSDSNAPVLISISSVKNITSEAHINVRVISGTLQAGDRIELCKPIKKTAYNRVNGVKTNIRKRHRLKTVVFSTITETDIQNYKNGKNIFTILLQTSGSNQKISSIDHSYTESNSPLKSPLTVRIVRPATVSDSTQRIQISNSVYLTLNYYSQVLKPM